MNKASTGLWSHERLGLRRVIGSQFSFRLVASARSTARTATVQPLACGLTTPTQTVPRWVVRQVSRRPRTSASARRTGPPSRGTSIRGTEPRPAGAARWRQAAGRSPARAAFTCGVTDACLHDVRHEITRSEERALPVGIAGTPVPGFSRSGRARGQSLCRVVACGQGMHAARIMRVTGTAPRQGKTSNDIF